MANREIKFRAWCPKNEEMYYADHLYHFCISATGSVGFVPYHDSNELHSFSTDPDSEELQIIAMQYIGLKDSNGKEIYEGDVRGGTYFCNNEACATLEVMQWDNYNLCFYWKRIKGGSMPDFISTEVIGNIYENPELLKGESEVSNG